MKKTQIIFTIVFCLLVCVGVALSNIGSPGGGGGMIGGTMHDVLTTGTISGATLVGASTITTHTVLTSLDMNRVWVVATPCEITLPSTPQLGTWVYFKIQDDSEKLEVALTNVADVFNLLDGTALTAGNEIDSASDANSGGDAICLMYMVANKWFSTAENGTWSDGGAAD